uniref:Secreted protein n=1 Tax=Pyxicephalus adspersus TaxID=30357 RepID=A0AAV3B4L7_PYXAD|nr:TPA: hypothetical protein GDO54_000102 [Pyxicephalus adspersus]
MSVLAACYRPNIIATGLCILPLSSLFCLFSDRETEKTVVIRCSAHSGAVQLSDFSDPLTLAAQSNETSRDKVNHKKVSYVNLS